MNKRWEYRYCSNGTAKVCSTEAEMAQYLADINLQPAQGNIETTVTSNHFGERVHKFNEDAANFLERFKRHHPMLKNPDPELQERIRQVRYDLGGQDGTVRDTWERYYRGQIDQLINGGGENFLAALTLMMPCMDRVFTLIYPDYDGNISRPRESYWVRVLKMFFPAFGLTDKHYKYLNENLRVGVIHDAFTRGDIGFSNSYKRDDYTDSMNVFVEYVMEDGRLILQVIVPWFWERVRRRIDLFYEHEQWIQGWAMHKILRLNPHSRTSDGDPT